ncbi:MAG: triple tyrosine motif-containing protein, partial [Bacteroidia bacterium]|nr:triple tyrosine motif-containing protein [Bacteroidia bacterium]
MKVDSKRRYVSYNRLNKGEYKFQVKSTDQNGVWTNDITSITVEVAPAPYETWWAYSLYVLIIALILYLTYRT